MIPPVDKQKLIYNNYTTIQQKNQACPVRFCRRSAVSAGYLDEFHINMHIAKKEISLAELSRRLEKMRSYSPRRICEIEDGIREVNENLKGAGGHG